MIKSDPAGDGDFLWLGCPIEAVHTRTCPSLLGSSSCCSPVLFAEMLRRITFGQKERKTKKKIKIPACLGGTYRQRATESSSSSWAAFLPHYSLLSKIAFGKVQGEATWTSGKAVFVPIRRALNFRWDWTHLAAHLFTYTRLASNFSLSLWWLEQIFAFMRGSPVPT